MAHHLMVRLKCRDTTRHCGGTRHPRIFVARPPAPRGWRLKVQEFSAKDGPRKATVTAGKTLHSVYTTLLDTNYIEAEKAPLTAKPLTAKLSMFPVPAY